MSFRERLHIFQKIDWVLLSAVVVLLAIGLAILYSLLVNAEDPDLARYQRQMIAVIMGLVLMIVLAVVNYRLFENYALLWFGAAITLLLVVIFFGTEIRGTKGWLVIGGVSLQPVELVKFLYILVMAKFFSDHGQNMHRIGTIMKSFIPTAMIVGLILVQEELGSVILIVATWFGMVFLTNIRRWQLALVALGFAAAAVFAFFFVLSDSQKSRLIVFVDRDNPEYKLKIGYNIDQSIVAIGSGQLKGRGLGLGPQSQLNFLPEQETDFIYASIAEELGFWGGSLVIVSFGVLLFRAMHIASRARDDFAAYLSWGIAALLLVQVWINVGMNMGLAPVTGIPLPFVSAGGSAMIANLMMVGLLQSLAIRARR